VAALGLYGVFRLYDLVHRGALRAVFTGSSEALLFQLEFGLGVLLPMAFLAQARVRQNAGALYASALLVVLGFVVNRLNVSITGLEGAQGGHYIPAVPELLITLMLVAVGFALFGLAVKYLAVFPREGPARPVET
jgi:Ni/Fe-hydrogenase subunit HybB-like protein